MFYWESRSPTYLSRLQTLAKLAVYKDENKRLLVTHVAAAISTNESGRTSWKETNKKQENKVQINKYDDPKIRTYIFLKPEFVIA